MGPSKTNNRVNLWTLYHSSIIPHDQSSHYSVLGFQNFELQWPGLSFPLLPWAAFSNHSSRTPTTPLGLAFHNHHTAASLPLLFFTSTPGHDLSFLFVEPSFTRFVSLKFTIFVKNLVHIYHMYHIYALAWRKVSYYILFSYLLLDSN